MKLNKRKKGEGEILVHYLCEKLTYGTEKTIWS